MSIDAQSAEAQVRSSIRVDNAHLRTSETVPPPGTHELADFGDYVESIDVAEQIRIQAGQLARHLQERRREVDHRETQLNARLAQLENDTRNSRMWMHERTEEFARREEELNRQLAELDARTRGLISAEAALDEARQQFAEASQAHRSALAAREQALQEHEKRLAEEAARMQATRDELDQARRDLDATLEAAKQPLIEHRQSLERLQLQLDERQKAMDEQWEELIRQREDLYQKAADAAEQAIRDRQELAQQRHQLELQQHRQQRTIQSQRERIDQRHTALERTRADILHLHREALEMRLVTEQLWTQLTSSMPTNELTKGLSRLRAQLGDEFRFAHQELANQRAALEALLPKLEEKQQAVTSQRDELVGWFERRHRDLAEQSAQLTQRERILEDDRQRQADLQRQWQATRCELEHQVQKLSAQVRRLETEAAMARL